MKPKLTIQILGWNSAAALPAALAALKNIPQDEAVVRYIDNDSRDDSVRLVRESLPGAQVVALKENSGFAGGHNAGLKFCQTELVMVHNPDLIIDWPGVRQVMAAFDDKQVGAAQGKIYSDVGKTIIDSAGVKMSRALNGFDRGAGKIDTGQFNDEAWLDAVTGAAGIYRIRALHKVAHPGGEIFDEDFFAYKEDVDLGWRLRRAGWQIKYVPVFMGVHSRAVGPNTTMAWSFNPISLKRRLGDRRTYFSLRNWVWTIAKNANVKQILKHEVFIDVRLLLFAAMSFMYWPLLKVWPETWQGLTKMLTKRNGS